MFDNLDRIDWQYMRSCAEKLSVGLLWGAGLVLRSPTHPTVAIVAVWIFVVFGSVTVLAFGPVLKAAKFPQIALLLAIFCIAHGSMNYIGFDNVTGDKSLMSQVTSCLKEFAAMTACFSTVLVHFHPVPLPEPQQDLEAKRHHHSAPNIPPPNGFFFVELGHRHAGDTGSYSDRPETMSGFHSLVFQHTGPGSTYAGTTHSSDDISLSSTGRVNQSLSQKIVQLTTMVKSEESARDEGDSTEPQPEFSRAQQGD